MLRWIERLPDKEKIVIGLVPQLINDNMLVAITSLDIKTHVIGQSISAWKGNERIFVWQLPEITEVEKTNNRLIINSDDKSPVTLIFVNTQEAELAAEKFNNAGNGQIV